MSTWKNFLKILLAGNAVFNQPSMASMEYETHQDHLRLRTNPNEGGPHLVLFSGCENMFTIPAGVEFNIPNPIQEDASLASLCGMPDLRIVDLCRGETIAHLPPDSKLLNPLQPEADQHIHSTKIRNPYDRNGWCGSYLLLTRSITVVGPNALLKNLFITDLGHLIHQKTGAILGQLEPDDFKVVSHSQWQEEAAEFDPFNTPKTIFLSQKNVEEGEIAIPDNSDSYSPSRPTF